MQTSNVELVPLIWFDVKDFTGWSSDVAMFVDPTKKRQTTHPCTLAINKLVVLCLHAGPAADIKVFSLEIGVVQLLWSL